MLGKLTEFVASIKSSKVLNLVILLLIVAAVPLTVFVAQKQQDIRQRASSSSMEPRTIKTAVIFVYFTYDATKNIPVPLGPVPSISSPVIFGKPTPPPMDPITHSYLTVSSVQNILQGVGTYGDPPASAFYNEVTYGKIRYNFDYYGWYQAAIPLPQTCDIYGLMTLSDNIVANKGVDLTPYQARIYIFPRVPCDGAGYGGKDASKPYSYVFINDTDITNIYSHELGHALNLAHAARWECSTPNDYTNNCTINERGDFYDIMGGQGYFNAPHQISLGLIQNDQIQTVTQSGKYIIVPVEQETGIKTIKILKPDTKHPECGNNQCSDYQDYYYVEYRRPIGIDKNVVFDHIGETTDKEGLEIHIWDGFTSVLDFTKLVNPENPVLHNGESFYDSINNVRIKLVSHDANNAVVDVQVGSSPTSPTSTLAPGQTITFSKLKPDGTTTVNNPVVFSGDLDDSVPWLGDRYLSLYIDGIKQQEGGLFYTRTSSSPPTIHQSTISSQYTLSAGTHRWKVRISDQTGATFIDSNEIQFSVSNLVTPTPTIFSKGISFSNLSPNSSASNPITFSGTINDNLSTIGYRYIYLYIDGSKVYSTYYAHLTDSLQNLPVSYTSTNTYPLGSSHNWYIKIQDPFGNSFSQSSTLNFTIGNGYNPISTPTPYWSPTSIPTKAFFPTPTTVLANPPNLAITSPAQYAFIKRGTSITVTVSVSDSIGVKRVDYSFGGGILCSSSSTPFSCTFVVPTSLPPGYGYLTATAYNMNNISASKTVTVILY